MEPASIRTKNPGAMWPGPIPTKWHSTQWIYLNDGTGQGGDGHGNKIAIFNNWVDGICAQMDLWRTSPKYRGKRFADAIAIWAGGNHVPNYIAFIKARVPGMTEDTVMDDKFWRSNMAMPFLKAQASHEAGKPYPAPTEDWIEAQKRVMGAVTRAKAAGTGAVIASGGGAAAAAAHAGYSYLEMGLTVFIVAGFITGAVLLIRKLRATDNGRVISVPAP